MKKSLLVSTLAVAFCAIVALAGTHKVKKIMVDNIQKSTTVKSLKSLSKAGEAADETPNLQVLLEEDFSKFTAGSEATPDATDVADATTEYIADELTNTPGWSGDGVFQAGGCAYIGIVDEGTDNEDTGFLNTSTFDGSGNGGYIVVTFRARVAEEGATDAVEFVSIDEDDINESDPMSGVVDYKQVAITDQWAEYEVELKSGAANASIQLYAYQSPIYIDDIKVVQTVKIDVPAPEALAATNVTPTSFTANWSAVEGATSYMLTVFSFKTIKSDVEEATVTEGFDGIVATGKKDKFIDTENSKLPEGWTISVSDNGTSREIYASSGNYHSEKIALAFDATGDFIETPEAPAEKPRSRRNRRRLTERRTARPAAALDVALLRANLEREAARMVQHHADRQRGLRLDKRLHVVLHAAVDPQRLELGQVLRDRIVETDLPLLDELRNRHAAEALRLRTLHERIVQRNRTLRARVGIADAVDLLSPVVVDDRNRARQLTVLDIRLEHVADHTRGRIQHRRHRSERE